MYVVNNGYQERAFINEKFTSEDICINKDIVPCLILKDQSKALYVTWQEQLLLLLDRFLYSSKPSPLKFQIDLFSTLINAGYKQFIKRQWRANSTKTRDQSSVMYLLTQTTCYTASIVQLWLTSWKNQIIKTYTDI